MILYNFSWVDFFIPLLFDDLFFWPTSLDIPSLKLTYPLKIGLPKRNLGVPTIHFQVLCTIWRCISYINMVIFQPAMLVFHCPTQATPPPPTELTKGLTSLIKGNQCLDVPGKLGSMVRINGLFHLLINGVLLGDEITDGHPITFDPNWTNGTSKCLITYLTNG